MRYRRDPPADRQGFHAWRHVSSGELIFVAPKDDPNAEPYCAKWRP